MPMPQCMYLTHLPFYPTPTMKHLYLGKLDQRFWHSSRLSQPFCCH